MPWKSTARAPARRLDWDAIKGEVCIEAVAVALMGEPSGRRGASGLWYVCPLHDDRNPSFHVDPDRGSWRCFGCSEHGDAPALAMRLEGLSFPEAVRRVAELCGLSAPSGDLPPPSRPTPAKATGRPEPGPSGLAAGDASALVEDAARRLWTPEGAGALSYLHGRGLTGETIRAARIGFVDRVAVPTRAGDRVFQASGIVVPWFDRDRLAMAKVRRLDDGKPKYAEAFRDRPRVFPPLEAIRPGLPLVVVEGEFDALLLHQLIVDFACVATLGSASDRRGADVLLPLLRCRPWFAAHDADDAGNRAASWWIDRGAVRVKPPAPAKDWTEAHALGFNVVRNLWLGIVRDAPRPSWEALEAERWGPALVEAEPDADADHAEARAERLAIREADGIFGEPPPRGGIVTPRP